jgi:hypothetical protein
MFETTVNITARLNGNFENMGVLAQNVYGKFEVTGGKGVTRIFARKAGLANTAVNLGSLALQGLAVLGGKNQAAGASAGAELIQLFNEVHFDSMKLQAERGADLSFKLTSVEILAPTLHVSGSGTIATKDVEQVPNAPMNITLQLGAKGNMAYALQKTGKLSSKQDDKGYNLMTSSFTIGGTPTKPDNSALYSFIGEAALGGLLGR